MRMLLLTAALLALPTSAFATSCSARHKACLNTCATQYAKSSGCTRYCGEALPVCLKTGCWKTPQADKCGYSKN